MGTDLQGEHTLWDTPHTTKAVMQPSITPALSFISSSAQNFIKGGKPPNILHSFIIWAAKAC